MSADDFVDATTWLSLDEPFLAAVNTRAVLSNGRTAYIWKYYVVTFDGEDIKSNGGRWAWCAEDIGWVQRIDKLADESA